MISKIVRRMKPGRLKRVSGRMDCRLIPLQHLTPTSETGSTSWFSHGEDPQFYLQPANGQILGKSRWLVLSYDFACEAATDHQVYLNRGSGYESDLVVNKTVEGTERVEITFKSSGDLVGLRLDPAMSQVAFSIDRVQLHWFPELPKGGSDDAPALTQFLANEAAGDYQFRPVNQIERDLGNGYHWVSQGNDPYFLLLQEGQSLHLKAGWYQLDLELAFPRNRQQAKFYFDNGLGFSEANVMVVAVAKNERNRRLVYLENDVVGVRFDPQENWGPFRVETLAFASRDEEEAKEKCLARINSSLDGFGALMTEQILSEAHLSAKKEQVSVSKVLHDWYQESFIEPPGILEYEEWMQDIEQSSLPDEKQVTKTLSQLENAPVISVIVPVYNTDEKLLRQCLESVLGQSYANWELCIADDASPAAHVAKVLREYEERDSRVKVIFRQENGHISEASNSALEAATGEYIALLDHDDELAEHALLFVAKAIDEGASPAILYSDEDKIDISGRRFDPHFKSDWNPDLFFSQNYVSHLGVYRADLLKKIGGFRKGLEGSQDQDLLLRCLPNVGNSKIVHIPRVLYHWRSVEGSTAMGASQKDYTSEAGLKALSDYFESHGPVGTQVEDGLVPNTYRVKWPVPNPEPLVSLLIPTRDRKDITEVAVRSILDKTTYPNYEILILDNGSVESETLEFFEEIQQEDDRVRVIEYDYPFNYSAINNYGVEHSQGSIIGLINNDIEVISPDWLTEMVGHASRQEIGCVGAKLYYSNDTVQHAGVILGLGGIAGHSHKHFDRNHPGYFHRLVLTQNLSAVTAACLLVRREVYEEVGGLDEENLQVAFNDVDFCLKVTTVGYRNLWTPHAELYHYESVSRGKEDSPEKIRRFQKEIDYMRDRWGDLLDADPGYSRNLTRDREDFSIGR
jgi:GT2 family glycosyltransferase